MSTIKEESQRVFAGGLTIGDVARPLFINKEDEGAVESAKIGYELTVARYKESGSSADHRKMLEAFARYSEATGKFDLRFSLPHP